MPPAAAGHNVTPVWVRLQHRSRTFALRGADLGGALPHQANKGGQPSQKQDVQGESGSHKRKFVHGPFFCFRLATEEITIEVGIKVADGK